jgi:uncharacterized protein YjbJ (UPF0337 family)
VLAATSAFVIEPSRLASSSSSANITNSCLRAKWGRLTEQDVQDIAGQRDILVKKLRERYDLLKHRAAKRADEWVASLSSEVGPRS